VSRFRRSARALSSPFELALERRLDDAQPGADSTGRPLSIKASPFILSAAEYLRAAAGPPAWSTRLARIEALRLELDQRLEAELASYRQRHIDCPELLAAAWRRHLAALDPSPLNDLISKHNAYYAIEAGLRMQWPSGRYLLPDGIEYPIEPVTLEALLARFPASPQEVGGIRQGQTGPRAR